MLTTLDTCPLTGPLQLFLYFSCSRMFKYYWFSSNELMWHIPDLNSTSAFKQAYSVASTLNALKRDRTSCSVRIWDARMDAFSVEWPSKVKPFAASMVPRNKGVTEFLLKLYRWDFSKEEALTQLAIRGNLFRTKIGVLWFKMSSICFTFPKINNSKTSISFYEIGNLIS